MKDNRLFLVLLLLLSGLGMLNAQNLLETLEQEHTDDPLYTLASFKATRIAIGQSVETRKKGVLEWHLMNRFWNIPTGRTQSFLADRLSVRFALEYGISDRLTFGMGGTTWDGIFDGFLKYRLVRQRMDKKGSPISITVFQNGSYRSDSYPSITTGDNFKNRLSFTSQVMIARKFNPNFSLQFTPSFVHRGGLLFPEDTQNHFVLGLGGRYKLGNHVSVVSEYHYVTNPIESADTYDAFAIGVNWEISDVILQFHMTNARSMAESAFLTQTFNNFNTEDGNFHFGFNFTYVLHFNKKKK
ncbi:DUF5777 family beta-barrel protein [Spongiimicrobium sp. 3-5]|uniref:DUF5777 family beta-barrel protein n=1 Tax=Spongiimicrobium sp. 3-5 TaxID=3332596 RepID=UPI0039804F33